MKKLKRSRSNRYIMGVCGGLGDYLNVDPTIVRLVWFIAALTSFGTFALVYIIWGLVIPEDDGIIEQDETTSQPKDNSKTFVGLALVVVGFFMLANIILPWFSISFSRILRFWPALLIILGVYILIDGKKK